MGQEEEIRIKIILEQLVELKKIHPDKYMFYQRSFEDLL